MCSIPAASGDAVLDLSDGVRPPRYDGDASTGWDGGRMHPQHSMSPSIDHYDHAAAGAAIP